jgi:hypothetical protein
MARAAAIASGDPVDRFIEEMAAAAWFAACGDPLAQAERADALAYAASLGFGKLPIATVPDWRAAMAVLQRPDWERRWWDWERAAEAALRKTAEARLREDDLLAALARVTQASDALHGAAALAAQRGGIADPTASRVAAGSAAQAAHQAALARLAEAGAEHVFAVKFRLFAAGRWPLAVVGGRCFVF